MSLSVEIEKRLGTFHLHTQLEAGDGATALLGASGCGKSMTLKCIAGIVTPDRGRIVLNDRVLFDSEKEIDLPPQQRRVGYLFQQYALFPNMTVEQNILCGIREGTRAEKRLLLAEKLRMFRLDGLEKKRPAQLSGGQQQRVALARILCSEPQAILLDEPFSALDSFLKWNLELELSELLESFRGPILWVSHDLGECSRNCPNVCVMEDGETGRITTMDALICRPGTVSAARLTGCKNFFRAERCDGGAYLPDWKLTVPVPQTAPETFATIAVPNDAIEVGGSLCFTVCRVVTDIEHDIALLRPEGAPVDVPPLRAELPKGVLHGKSGALQISLRTEKLLLF